MSELRWQKSSFSEGGAANCVEVARDHTGTVHLRESDTPGVSLASASTALAALLGGIKGGVAGGC